MVRSTRCAGIAGLACSLVFGGLAAGATHALAGEAATTPAWPALTPSIIYTKDAPPATPGLAELPLVTSVSQYGITWTFEKPARVGQFVNGDFYVVGPVTVVGLEPKTLVGEQVPKEELGPRETAGRRNDRRYVRNGSMLNPPARQEVAYDSAILNWFRPNLLNLPPIAMKPADSLVSTISLKQGEKIRAFFRTTNPYAFRENGDDSPVRTAAVLTCVDQPQPPDAFRPSFCDRTAKIHLARDLRRDLLPKLAMPTGPIVLDGGPTTLDYMTRVFQRPWVNTGFFGFEEPVENMPLYGSEVGRAVGVGALLLCCDLPAEQKEALLINYVQVGIDLGGIIRSGHPGWEGFGGHGSGRKLPIVFAGLLLGDEQLANVNKSFPKASFAEDEQTAYGDSWTGAKVVFTGHRGIDEATGIGRADTGPYEHKDPAIWTGIAGGPQRWGDKCSESYRRCCTSICWVGQALALHLMKAEGAWDHDAFFDYCDRWMYEEDSEFLKILRERTGGDYGQPWSRQGQAWDDFVNEMWAKYRTAPGMPPIDGWRKQHDDGYIRDAIEKAPPGRAAAR